MIWASKYGHTEIVKFLIEKGADIEDKNNNGYTPLIWTSSYGYTEIIKFLVEKGADIEAKNNNGDTPLICAFENRRIEIIKFLIEKGANYEVLLEKLDEDKREELEKIILEVIEHYANQ